MVACGALGLGPAAADEITTRAGDRLTGRIVAIGCDGLDVEYLSGQRLRIPLDVVATATTASALTVSLQGGDRVTGRLVVDPAAVRIDSPVLGIVAVPGEVLARLPRGHTPKSSSCPSARQGPPLPEPGPAAHPTADRAVASDRTLATVRGTGTAPTAAFAIAAAPAEPEPAASAPAAAVTGSAAEAPAVPETLPPAESPAAAQTAPAAGAPAEAETEAEGEPLQFLRADAVLLQPYKLEADLALAYLHNNQTIQNDKVASVTAALRFGLIQGMEGFALVPYAWGRREINTFNGVDENNANGIGDVRFGVKYSLVPQSLAFPNIIASLSASAPTGDPPYLKPPPGASADALSRDIRDPFAVQLGTGHWSISPGLTAIKSFDPLILFASANYTHYFPEEFYGVNVEPGDLYDVNAGLGFAVNDSGTISGQVFAGYQEEWVFDGTHVAETSSSPISLRFAYTHILSARSLIEPSVLFGLTGDANDALLSLAYSHNF
ncbi:MAG: transporter [Rhodospirillales bacterium]